MYPHPLYHSSYLMSIQIYVDIRQMFQVSFPGNYRDIYSFQYPLLLADLFHNFFVALANNIKSLARNYLFQILTPMSLDGYVIAAKVTDVPLAAPLTLINAKSIAHPGHRRLALAHSV